MKGPLHPMFVHFPIALLVLSVTADWIGYLTGALSLQHAGWWSLLGAAAGAAVAVPAGVHDMQRADISDHVHHYVHRHMYIGLTLLGTLGVLAIWRGIVFFSSAQPSVWYLVLATAALLLIGYQGWLGGELVYRHGVSVRAGKGKED